MKFVGDPIAIVVAENRYLAEDALELIDVEYDPLPAIADFTKAVGHDAVVHQAYPDNVAGGLAGAPPDEEAFAAAAYVADERIYQQTHVPVPIETRGLVVEWIAATQELTVGFHPDPARIAPSPHDCSASRLRACG